MEDKTYIFGAHSRAQTLAVYLQALNPGMVIEAYLYNNEEPNPEKVGGVPVRRLKDGGLCTRYPVYIGTRGTYHEEVMKELRALGFEDIRPVDVALDIQLRNAYMERHFICSGRDFLKIEDLESMEDGTSVAVYVAKSIYDGPLKQPYKEQPYERLIQVGAALTERRLPDCMATDDKGDNISSRNRQFCELTALYWIWRNSGEDVVGLVHYRRHFILPPDWLDRMVENNVDVVVPVPLYVAPSLAGNYKDRHDPQVWDAMMLYLKERDEREYGEAEAFFQQNLYCPCNMFIMRREVLERMCSWLFPILFTVAERMGEKADPYQNRYPGFLSERLVSFFLEKNRDRYKIVYADKNFLA